MRTDAVPLTDEQTYSDEIAIGSESAVWDPDTAMCQSRIGRCKF